MKRLILLACIVVVVFAAISVAFLWRADGETSWKELGSADELQRRFNEDEGSIRIVLLLSPTWPVCFAGARWVQSEILETHPEVDVVVYAISFQMLASDRIAKWMVEPHDLLSDSRAVHYWDAGRVVGRFYEERVTRLGDPGDERIEWDAYFLYGPEATWGVEPPPHISWGRTIVDSRDRLLRDFVELVKARLLNRDKQRQQKPGATRSEDP